MSREPLLVIPHAFSNTAKIRGAELAQGLAHQFDVYCLRWKDVIQVYQTNPWLRRLQQLTWGLSSIIPGIDIQSDGRIHYIEVPVVQPTLFHRLCGSDRAWRWAGLLNSHILCTCLNRLNLPIRKILVGAFHYDLEVLRNFQLWFDICDITGVDEGPLQGYYKRSFYEFIKKAQSCCKGLFIPNSYLQRWLEQEFHVHAEVVPNGAWTESLRAPEQSKVAEIRRRHGLNNKFVIGYFGNHTDSAGIDFLIEVLRYSVARSQDLAFLIVGPLSQVWRDIVKPFEGHPQLITTGPLPAREIVNYLHCVNVGVFCSPPCYQHRAYTLPLKVLEYSAARRFVIATPLELMRELDWPYLTVPEYSPAAWFNAIEALRSERWQTEWDGLIDEYDWERIAARLAPWLNGRL